MPQQLPRSFMDYRHLTDAGKWPGWRGAVQFQGFGSLQTNLVFTPSAEDNNGDNPANTLDCDRFAFLSPKLCQQKNCCDGNWPSMFEITDYYELKALCRVLHEARYHKDHDSPEVQGSPFVAAIHERVLAAIFKHENWSDDRIHHWMLWRNRGLELERVRLYLTQCQWDKCSEESKRSLVENLVRPFVATEAEIDALMQFADDYHQNNGE